jgi:hypothetical protein
MGTDISELSTIERQTLLEGQVIFFGSVKKRRVKEGKENQQRDGSHPRAPNFKKQK